MTVEKQDVPSGPHVEVTIKSIHGISWKSDELHSLPPALKASAAFKGSGSSMRVTSFTLCGRTGDLVVQSSSMELDEEAASRIATTDNEYRLVAAFDDPLTGGQPVIASRSSSTGSTSTSSSRPHLKIDVPKCRPSLSLSSANVDSTRTGTPTPTESTSGANDLASRFTEDQSLSDSKSPISVEIHVCLQSDDDGILQEGVAHLLFYGDEHFDVTTLDLPIETKVSPTSDAKEPSVLFQADARIRVQIEMAKEHPCKKIDLQLSEQLDEKKMDGFMNQLRENEALAAVRARTAKLNFRNEPAGKQKNSSRHFFCSSGSEIGLSLQAFLDTIKRYGGRKTGAGKRYNRFGILRTNSTMATTIATRESLDI
jgi:hypothetical protein